MPNKFSKIVFVAALIGGAFFPGSAFAYIGPGAGLSVLGVIFSLIAAFFLAIVGFVWYPVRRLLRGGRRTVKPDAGPKEEQSTTSPQSSED